MVDGKEASTENRRRGKRARKYNEALRQTEG